MEQRKVLFAFAALLELEQDWIQKLLYPIPDVCVSKSRIVMARRGGRDSSDPSGLTWVTTFMASIDGRYRFAGSSSPRRPDSMSIMIAAEVIGLPIDAILKIAFSDSGALLETSRLPAACSNMTSSALVTSTTTAGTSPRRVAVSRR